MKDIISIIWLLSIIIVIFGSIPYLIWIIKTLKKKEYKAFKKQLLYPSLFFIFLYGLTLIVNKVDRKIYLGNIFDCSISFDDPIYEYYSERSFNGDGYSFVVFELPSDIEARFKTFDQKLKEDYPIKPDYRKEWHIINWKQAPFSQEFQDQLNFSLSTYDADKEMKNHFQNIRSGLSEAESYYSFFYNTPSTYIGDIDFFMVDLKRKKVYFINHNT